MGSLNFANTVLPALNAAGSVLSTIKTYQTSEQQLDQLKKRQRLEEQQAAQSAVLQREQLGLQAAQDEDTRRDALRRAVARQRASFGASGIRGAGGSTEAVLLGLTNETEDELRRRNQLDDLRNRAIDQNLSQGRLTNVLQATQQSERNNLSNLYKVIGV